MSISMIQRVGIKDAVYQQMLRAISTGEWKIGEKIPSENRLTELFHVSRITIRESIQMLVSLGMLESKQGGGTYVCEPDGSQLLNLMVPFFALTDQSLDHMLEFRKIIEGGSAYLAAARATETDIRKLRDNVCLMEESENEIERRTMLDIEFHLTIAQATGNPIIAQIYKILKPVWQDSMSHIVHKMGSYKALHYHRLLIQALEDHSPERAKAIMDEHIVSTIQNMKDENAQTSAATEIQ